VEARLAEQLGVPRVLLTTSCTHAMELALLALGIGPGDEVVCPSFTFVSTANAVLRVGARPGSVRRRRLSE
jgi:dTDP-4-amino-4,6-dideoxygalactose transaminase